MPPKTGVSATILEMLILPPLPLIADGNGVQDYAPQRHGEGVVIWGRIEAISDLHGRGEKN